MNYKISIEASYDLEKIWLYTFDTLSAEQADRYLKLILDEIEYLCSKPNSGKDFSHIRKGCFRTKVKSHLIFYKINVKQNEIEIIRVLHQMMDIENHLK
ncbi:type II toxin-antitoxin system RelE/ParE family toxin [Flavobacterium quisquiliarum]|jgi:toxin ParE1/3/4|uniref:Toxin n=1 Tax=Flavobacterium quisquiliarum TaxID=1834436 RepID=A0ABV8WG18_9FLAO|nr:type II toxin-antitoxin system RelE/ParE family toxin [Flavobacterium quisquiliarum]MBW1657428.1 type II toxin-antitoxin system RelE/ParE family toxin [Flavobacterium quisquiliarum]NWK99415.1 type II toxin-antitoxin system RelE/ParE family toxin [Flavobacterium collinsii]